MIEKTSLRSRYVGKHISELRTPALLIDRAKFAGNCQRLSHALSAYGLRSRAHVKTHKTAEGTRLQVEPGIRALIASTLPEVWGIIEAGLVDEDLVDDILYSLPVDGSKMPELAEAQAACGRKARIRVMVDHANQVIELEKFSQSSDIKWSVFCKVDGGGQRAGAPPESPQMGELIEAAHASTAVEIFGFYSHFGHSYGSKSPEEAQEYYQAEIACVNRAAQVARGLGVKGDLVLSVGATPTALAATPPCSTDTALEGSVEVHAGCYCMLDCQQLAVGIARPQHVSISVLARVISVYPDRQEAMCDAGALAVSKDIGQWPGFGRVVSPAHLTDWDLGRVSQEHGTLVHRPGVQQAGVIAIGDLIKIVPQHACLACACHPWYYVVEDERVVDVWVPWRGW